MDRIDPLVLGYTELMARYATTDDEVEREKVLIEAGELAKLSMTDGPAIDLMHELHQRCQRELARRWRTAPAGSAHDAARERLVRGDAITLLLAMTLPHELAQRAHHEQRWRREHETLVAMFEQTDDLIVVLDPDGLCDDVNPAFCQATGWSRREAVEGAASWDQPPGSGDHKHQTTQQQRRDGSHFTVEWSISPVLGSKGILLNYVCIGRDIERQQRIDNGLRENDKLRAIATLAGGIAHDFNNLLGSIQGLAELCCLEAVPGSRQERNLGRILQATGTAAALVRQMLDFSRQSPAELQRLDMAQWLEHAEPLLRAAIPRQLEFSVLVAGDGAVLFDPVQMEQVLLNLVRNAAHAMTGRSGAIRVEADCSDPAHTVTMAAEPTHLRIRVIDQGSGIPREIIGKIFEPFFTTKPVGEGTGLGLAAVHGIVTRLGGAVEVASEVGVGTTLSIFLPLAPPLPAY